MKCRYANLASCLQYSCHKKITAADGVILYEVQIVGQDIDLIIRALRFYSWIAWFRRLGGLRG